MKICPYCNKPTENEKKCDKCHADIEVKVESKNKNKKEK